MSGGHFDYAQSHIDNIVESIQEIIDKNGALKTKDEIKEDSWRDSSWYDKYPEDLYHYKYSDNIIEEFKTGVHILKKAKIYAQRIDWLLSGDDGDNSFFTRLSDELSKID